MQPHRLGKQALDPLLVVLRGVVEVEVVVDLPVASRLSDAAAHPEEVAGQQLADSLEERLAGEAELEGQVVLQPLEVGLDGRKERQQRLRLGREVEDVADLGVVERLDAEAVAHAEQLLLGFVPDGVGEHPAQVAERLRSPAVVRAHDDLGVGAGAPRASELRAQLGVVVDLAVVGQPAARLVAHRLVAGGAGVDDAQPPVAEAHVAALMRPGSGVVGTPVGDQVVHHLEPGRQVGDGLPAQVDGSADSAHGWGAHRRRSPGEQSVRVQPAPETEVSCSPHGRRQAVL